MNLLNYIKGLRSGKEAHYIERKAMRDPLLNDALEGYDSIEGDHAKQIELLSAQVTRRIQKSNDIKRSLYLRNWSIAAGILLCICIGGYFLVNEKNHMGIENLQSGVLEQNKSEETPEESELQDKIPEESESKEKSQTESELQEKSQAVNKDQDERISPKTTKTPVLQSSVVRQETISSDEEILVRSDLLVEESESIVEDEKNIEVSEIVTPSTAASKRDIQAALLNKISGIVVDGSGVPLAGVSIQVSETNTGTVSGDDGKFELRAPADSRLSFDFIGFETKKMVADTGNMLIAMNESSLGLSEVVVVGNRVQRKKVKLGYAIPADSVTKEIMPVPVTGMNEYRKYMRINTSDSLYETKGTVEVSFYVNASGRPYNIVIEKSLCEAADNEAIRLINEGCDWTIGSKQVTIDVKFK